MLFVIKLVCMSLVFPFVMIDGVGGVVAVDVLLVMLFLRRDASMLISLLV